MIDLSLRRAKDLKVRQIDYCLWEVESDRSVELVRMENGKFKCSCPYYNRRARLCSHILATINLLTQNTEINNTMSLEDLKGIGPKAVEKLAKIDIYSIADLAVADPKEVAKILGVPTLKARELISEATTRTVEAIVLETGRRVAEERKKRIFRIPTGSTALDNILGGGISSEATTGLLGEFGSGKTQICYSTAFNCIAKLGKKVIWLETEPQTYQGDRFEEIAKNRGYKNDILDQIYVVPASQILTEKHLFLAYKLVESKIKKGEDIGLIIIDSFTAPISSSYAGREMLPLRSQATLRHFKMLNRLAIEGKLAVLMTLQIMDVPDSNLQLQVSKKFGIKKKPVGGNKPLHSLTYIVALEQVSRRDMTFRAILADGPLPPREAIFRITSRGIEDIVQKKVGKIRGRT